MRSVIVTEDEGCCPPLYELDPIGVTQFDLGFIYIYILCGCLGFYTMYLKATINKILSLSMDVGHIDRTT